MGAGAQVIRHAELADSLAITAMAKRFAEAAGVGLPFSAPYAEARARAVIGDPSGVVLLWDDGQPRGVLAGMVGPHPLFPVTVASELLWWIEPAARGLAWRSMLRAFEAWARSRGADRVVMACLDDRAARLYARTGYAASGERHWVKGLQ